MPGRPHQVLCSANCLSYNGIGLCSGLVYPAHLLLLCIPCRFALTWFTLPICSDLIYPAHLLLLRIPCLFALTQFNLPSSSDLIYLTICSDLIYLPIWSDLINPAHLPLPNFLLAIAVVQSLFGVSDEKREAADPKRMLIAASGSPVGMRKKKPIDAMANGEEPHPDDQTHGPNISIWSPFGELNHCYLRLHSVLSHDATSGYGFGN